MNITILIIAVTCITSFIAFNNEAFKQNMVSHPYFTWRKKEWYRMVSNGFVHADIMHLLFNMYALYGFGAIIEEAFEYIYGVPGRALFVIMYFGAIIVADVWDLFKEKDNFSFTSLGASGGVAAIIFSAILLDPFAKIGILFIPGDGIPAYIFGPLYIAYCVYMARRGGDHIGHVPHLVGSVFGFVFPIIFAPWLFTRFINLLTNGALA